MRLMTCFAAISLAVLATPAFAKSNDIACMAQGYDAPTLNKIVQLGPQVDIAAGPENTANDELSQIAVLAVKACMIEHGWNEMQAFNAILYEIGRLQEAAFRQYGPLTPEQISGIDAALATGDRSALWAILEAQAQKGIDGRPVDVTEREAMLLGIFIVGAGLPPTEEAGEVAGLLLGMMALQRMGAREFAKLK